MTKNEKIKLILRQLNGESDWKEDQEFSQWLLDNPKNLDLYIDIKKLWESPIAHPLQFSSTKAEKRINKALHKKKRKIPLWQSGQKIAAAVVILVAVGIVSFHQIKTHQTIGKNTEVVQQITKTSGAGEQFRVRLPDGSIVHLNAGSSVQFPKEFGENSRQVKLTGEAFFEITKDAKRPFTVKSKHVATTVLGTSFNIKAFEYSEITVTVATGKVKVKNCNGNYTNEILLLPNQQAIYKDQEKKFQMTEVIAKNYYAWTDGVIQFNNDPLHEVIKILERWYNVRIFTEGAINKEIRITGSYKDKNLQTILGGLSFMYDLSYHYENNNIVIIIK